MVVRVITDNNNNHHHNNYIAISLKKIDPHDHTLYHTTTRELLVSLPINHNQSKYFTLCTNWVRMLVMLVRAPLMDNTKVKGGQQFFSDLISFEFSFHFSVYIRM